MLCSLLFPANKQRANRPNTLTSHYQCRTLPRECSPPAQVPLDPCRLRLQSVGLGLLLRWAEISHPFRFCWVDGRRHLCESSLFLFFFSAASLSSFSRPKNRSHQVPPPPPVHDRLAWSMESQRPWRDHSALRTFSPLHQPVPVTNSSHNTQSKKALPPLATTLGIC